MKTILARVLLILFVGVVFAVTQNSSEAHDEFREFELQMCYTQCDIDEYECRRDWFGVVTRYYFGFDICEIQMMMCYERCQMMYLPPIE